MKTKLFRYIFNKHTGELVLTALLIVLLIICDLAVFARPAGKTNSAPVQEAQAAPKIASDQLDSLVAPPVSVQVCCERRSKYPEAVAPDCNSPITA